jgi:hypothetical protein
MWGSDEASTANLSERADLAVQPHEYQYGCSVEPKTELVNWECRLNANNNRTSLQPWLDPVTNYLRYTETPVVDIVAQLNESDRQLLETSPSTSSERSQEDLDLEHDLVDLEHDLSATIYDSIDVCHILGNCFYYWCNIN